MTILPGREEKWYTLMEHAPVMFQSIGPDGRFAYVNRAWREALGYTTEEAMRLTLADVVDPACEGTCRTLFGEPVPGCGADEVDAVFLTSGGEELRVRGTSLCLSHLGRPEGSMAIFVPAACEPAPPAGEGRSVCMEHFLGVLSVPVYCKDRQGRLAWANAAFETFTGRATEALPGMPSTDLVPPHFAGRLREMDEQLLATGGVQQFEGPVALADGIVRLVTFTQVACEDAPGEITGILGTFHEAPAAGEGGAKKKDAGEWCAVPGEGLR